MLALGLWLVGKEPGSRTAPGIAALLAVTTIGITLFPLLSADRVADAHSLSLDLGRYLRSRIDSEGPGHPDRTVRYATMAGNRIMAVDVYLPRERLAPSRPILVVHGGFWSAGQRGEATLSSRRLADLGFTVFDVEYRTSPQPNWQAAIGDLKCAIGWVKQHARTTDWKVDPDRLTLLGRSAGGQLALVAAYAPEDPVLLPTCDVGGMTLNVESVIALYAPTDLSWGYTHPGNTQVVDSSARMRAFVGGNGRRRDRALPLALAGRAGHPERAAHPARARGPRPARPPRAHDPAGRQARGRGGQVRHPLHPLRAARLRLRGGRPVEPAARGEILSFLADTSKPAPPRPAPKPDGSLTRARRRCKAAP